MNCNIGPKQQSPGSGFTLPELLGVIVILAVLAAVFFPVFRQSRSSPNGAVQDNSGKPVPGAVLRFRDPAGRVVATITADKKGEFRRRPDDLSKDSVDGFRLSYLTHRTGSSDLYVFTPVEMRIAALCDEAGRPVPSLAVSFGPDHNTWQHQMREPHEQVSDSKGTIQIHQDPESTYFEFQSRDPKFIVDRFQRSDDGHTVRYAVTVTTPGAIIGCLRGKDGRPLLGCQAFATISPDLDRFDRWYADDVTGTTGRFHISNLRPRVYYVSVAPARDYHAVAPAQRVTLAPGQTAEVNLRADTLEQSPHAH